MITELLTGLIAGFTSGYLFRGTLEKKEEVQVKDLKIGYSIDKLKKMAGINDPVDKVTISGQSKNKDQSFWWQEYGAEKHYKKNGKYPETKEELDVLQKKNWTKLREQEEEGEIHLTKEAKKQYRL